MANPLEMKSEFVLSLILWDLQFNIIWNNVELIGAYICIHNYIPVAKIRRKWKVKTTTETIPEHGNGFRIKLVFCCTSTRRRLLFFSTIQVFRSVCVHFKLQQDYENTTWFIVFPAKWTESLNVNQHIQLQLNRENEWTVYRSGRETRTRREGKRWSSEKTKKRLTIRERERLVRGWLTSTFLNWLTSTWLAFPNLYFLLMEQFLPLKPKKHQGPVPDLWKLIQVSSRTTWWWCTDSSHALPNCS